MKVVKTSIISIILYITTYIILHYIIGKITENLQKELEQKPGNQELEQKTKYSKLMFFCFPFIYVIFIIIMFFIFQIQ